MIYVLIYQNHANGDSGWTRFYEGPTNSGGEYIRGMTLDPLGDNIFVIVHEYEWEDEISYNSYCFWRTIKYNSSGELLWAVRYEGEGICHDEPDDDTADDDDDDDADPSTSSGQADGGATCCGC